MAKRRYYSKYSKKRFGSSLNTETIVFFAVVLLVLFFAAYVGLDIEKAVLAVFMLIIAVGILVLGIAIVMFYKRRQREKSLELSDVMHMTGIEFENYLQGLLTFKGFIDVKVTPSQGDYGADLICKSEGKRFAVQAKQYNTFKPVGVEAIYQVLGGQKKYDCDETMVITTGVFTDQAYILADKSKTILVDRYTLADWITEYRRR